MNDSPLSRYKRQPKLSIDLPSQGKFWKEGSCTKFEELEVYSMTAADEISTKTPDTLFSGQTTAGIIQNCIPGIKNPWYMPVLDLTTILAAIRLASYGEDYSLASTCSKCSEENQYSISLQKIIDSFSTKEWQDTVYIDDLTFYLKPMTYKEMTELQKSNFVIQRQILQQIVKMEEGEEKEKKLKEAYTSLAGIKAKIIIGHVTAIEVDGETVTNRKEIEDFLVNDGEKTFYNAISEVVVRNSNNWAIPPMRVKCSNEECGHEWDFAVDLDYSNFFVQR
jgi:hypothetical protein